MSFTWTPSSFVLTVVHKPNATIFNISAESDDVDAVSTVYTVISEDFPDTSNIAVDGSGVHITGDTIQEFQDGSPLLYMRGGTVKASTNEPDDLVAGDDPYSWNPDPATSKDVSITIRADALDIGELILESEEQTYTLTIYNNWDAHKASMNSLMERIY